MRYRQPQSDASKNSRFRETASVFVRFDHIASRIVNASHGVLQF
jgi:hypothetical protein